MCPAVAVGCRSGQARRDQPAREVPKQHVYFQCCSCLDPVDCVALTYSLIIVCQEWKAVIQTIFVAHHLSTGLSQRTMCLRIAQDLQCLLREAIHIEEVVQQSVLAM